MVWNLSLRFPIIFFPLNIYVFTLGCARSPRPHMSLLWLWQGAPLSGCGVRASRCGGLSGCAALALGCMGFRRCGLQALEHRLRGYGTQASLPCSIWNIPGPGMELVIGRFLTTKRTIKEVFWEEVTKVICTDAFSFLNTLSKHEDLFKTIPFSPRHNPCILPS